MILKYSVNLISSNYLILYKMPNVDPKTSINKFEFPIMIGAHGTDDTCTCQILNIEKSDSHKSWCDPGVHIESCPFMNRNFFPPVLIQF